MPENAVQGSPLAVTWDDERICHAVLSREGAGNALSRELVDALERALDECCSRRVRLLVLRGAGKHFCTGFDLSDLAHETDDSLLARFTRIELLLQRVHRAPFATLAIAHGRTMGAGADLFAACTHRLVMPGTSFAFPGAKGFGLVLGTRRLAHRVGAAQAQDWVVNGSAISTEAALRSGLATDETTGEIDWSRYLGAPGDCGTDPLLGEALRGNAASDDAHDLAALVRSAARPGLKDRVISYVDAAKAQRSAVAAPAGH